MYDIIKQKDVIKMLEFPASFACQVRMNIRCKKEMSYNVLTKIFKKEIPIKQEHYRYLYGFFEECYPTLIKKYMSEQKISKAQILHIYNLLPPQGEKFKFGEVLKNGQF